MYIHNIYIYIHNIHTYIYIYIYTSCAQVHKLPWGHWWIVNNREGTLSVFFDYIYIIDVYMYLL